MEIIRLTTWIAAPEERCFRLATCAAFHEALAKGTIKRPPKEQDDTPLFGGDQLVWPGHRIGMQLRYTTRIAGIRPTGYFHEVLVMGRHFTYLEHDHHFTTLNDGTRVRDELRYCLLSPAPAGLIVAPLVRRYLTARIAQRNQVLKLTAETELWHRYLSESTTPMGSLQQHPGPESSISPDGRVAEHRH